ncbi:MAG: hypothetical protein ABIG44_17995 [Planctomycetota bacterium]
MMHTARTIRWIIGILILGLSFDVGHPAYGQERPRPPAHERGERWPRTQRAERGKHRPRHGGQHWASQIFRPTKEDYGPLREGEEAELREFLQTEMPRLQRLLARVKDHNAQEFERNLHRLIPRLRQLRRIHARDPELATLIGEHSEHLFRAGMLRRAWQDADEETRDELENQIRAELAAALRSEVQALKRWAQYLEDTRAEHIQERVEALLAEDADLSPEPERLRTQVDALRAEVDSARRLELITELTQMVGVQLDREIEGLRQHAQKMKTEAREEVDRRVQRWLEGPRGRRGP